MAPSDDMPAFEMRAADGRCMLVYADGRTTGFPSDFTITINRIPMLIHAASPAAMRGS